MDSPTSLKKTNHLANLGAFGSASAVGQFMMMLFTFLLARYVGPENYGFYISSFSLLFLTSIIFNNGLDTWLLNQKRSQTELHKDYSQILTIKFLGGLLWVAVIVIFAPLFRPDLYVRTLLIINAVDIWTDAILLTSLAVLNIQGKVKQYAFLMVSSRTFKLLSLILLVLVSSSNIIAFAIGRALVSLIIALIVVGKLKPRVVPVSWSELFDKVKNARYFALSEFLATIYMQIDITLLNLMVGSLQVGIYSPASNIVNAVFVLPSAIHLYTLPLLTRHYHDDHQRFKEFSKRVNLLTAVLGVVLSGGVFFLGGWFVVKFLGSEYIETSKIITLLSPILLMKCLEFGFASVIVAGGEQKKRILPQIAASIVNILFNILLIPRLGAVGAAKTYLLSESILMLWYGWIAFSVLKKIQKNDGKDA